MTSSYLLKVIFEQQLQSDAKVLKVVAVPMDERYDSSSKSQGDDTLRDSTSSEYIRLSCFRRESTVSRLGSALPARITIMKTGLASKKFTSNPQGAFTT